VEAEVVPQRVGVRERPRDLIKFLDDRELTISLDLLVSLMLLPILLLRDELVLVGEPLSLPRVARGGRGLLRGADREAGRQPIEVVATARRARDRRVLGARQGLELVPAHAAMKVV